MKTLMKLQDLTSVDQLQEFLSGTRAMSFSLISDKDECYRWLQGELGRFRYLHCSRADKGVIMRYRIKVSGYSRQQLTRLVAQYRQSGRLQRRQRTVAGFKTRYTAEDVRLLAAMDSLHDTPCGPKVKKLCERASTLFGQIEYSALASISVSHLYNLRKSAPYQRQRRHYEKTRPTALKIGERRKPRPDGKPGYIRIDTVHQGDQDKLKGVYHINAVDEVTQFEMVCSVEKISERYLVPALEQLLEDYPFKIRGFNSDNGSEYINYTVAKLLDKLRIEFTKSRSRQSNDNALVESKNASVIRKQFGYEHIQQRWAPLLNSFHRQHLNPYINFHRPCFFPDTHIDAKGKQRKRYPYANLKTPYEKLKSLARAKQYLKPGVSFATLDQLAGSISDNQAAEQLQKARQKLFKTIHGRELGTG